MLGLTLCVNTILAILFFYLIPTFGITPKTNLFLAAGIFACLELYWRLAFNRVLSTGGSPNKVLLIGNGGIADIIAKTIHITPQLGYEIKDRITEEKAFASPNEIQNIVLGQKINIVVVPHSLKNNAALAGVLYELLGRGIEIRDLVNFHEIILRNVPLAGLEETWFLENIADHQRFYDDFKRAIEVICALSLGILLSPLLLLIAVLVKLSSRGPIIFKQVRIGRYNRPFVLYKFRDMRIDAEKNGPQWKSSGTRDPRLTWKGRILVPTHLDELLQLFNILKGEMSLIGPRPPLPLETQKYKRWQLRRLSVKPGLSCFWQIKPYRNSIKFEEWMEMDLAYIDNWSLRLDFIILLKTILTVFQRTGL
jgi:exopolysaccharide biosynthesis polyprenyl glycosylphosphotransferase